MRFLLVQFRCLRPGFSELCNAKGQSMVEFVAVLTALFLIAGLSRGYITQLKNIIEQKYRSYCFGIAITDPPQQSYNLISGSEDAGRTMVLSERISVISPARESENSAEVLPVLQDTDKGAIRDFTDLSENF